MNTRIRENEISLLVSFFKNKNYATKNSENENDSDDWVSLKQC